MRVVVTGPECTGKTTLAQGLAAELGVPWVPEAARVYVQRSGRPGSELTLADVDPIARLHVSLTDEAAATGSAAEPASLVLDTDLISTVVYSRDYYGTVSSWIVDAARERRGDLYLLCAPDLPWTPDGVRDRPVRRDEMFGRFRDALAEFGAAVSEVRGTGADRLRAAQAAVTAARTHS
jgi:NadR type nicotinamide-nucleotide adenylyltransferase